jgi:hypothetical protein
MPEEIRLTARLDMSLQNDVGEVARVIDSLEEFGADQGIAAGQTLRFALALDELIKRVFNTSGRGRA